MIKHNLDIGNRYLTTKDYIFDNTGDILMKDEIFAYHDGLSWKIIPLNLLKKYPVIHDQYYDDISDTTFPITVALCPFTLVCSVFAGLYIPSEYMISSSLILTNSKGDLLPIISGYSTNPDGETHRVKRWECFIKIFRNAITEYPDCLYLKKNNDTNIQYILDSKYYVNNDLLYSAMKSPDMVHPKTLVYVLQYRSLKTGNDKYTIIVGKDATIDFPTGYNVKDSGIMEYIDSMHFKLNERSVFIMPILWFSWINFYPYAKIIRL